MINTSNIELKNIKVHLGLSHETHAYTASVYLNGQRVGTVENAGHGGPDQFNGPLEVYRQMNDWCKANLPAEHTDIEDPNDPSGFYTYQPDFEALCQAQVEVFLLQKEVRALLAKDVVFREQNDTGLRTMTYRKKGKKQPYSEDMLAAFRKSYPDALVLNELPIEKACEIYLANVA